MTPEGAVKAVIDRTLKRLKESGHPIYWHKPVQNGMGAPTLDYVGCSDGRYFAIEAKAPGKKPTAIQNKTIHEIETARGTCFVVFDGDTLYTFELWAMRKL